MVKRRPPPIPSSSSEESGTNSSSSESSSDDSYTEVSPHSGNRSPPSNVEGGSNGSYIPSSLNIKSLLNKYRPPEGHLQGHAATYVDKNSNEPVLDPASTFLFNSSNVSN
ncbi:hypothetical protein GEMRC1_005170 [Eukaryota sp. GEM-RC1]